MAKKNGPSFTGAGERIFMDSANFPTFRTKAAMPSLPPRSETRAAPPQTPAPNPTSKPKR